MLIRTWGGQTLEQDRHQVCESGIGQVSGAYDKLLSCNFPNQDLVPAKRSKVKDAVHRTPRGGSKEVRVCSILLARVCICSEKVCY